MKTCHSFNSIENSVSKNKPGLKPTVSSDDVSNSINVFTLSPPMSYGKFLSENKFTTRKLRRHIIKRFYNKMQG